MLDHTLQASSWLGDRLGGLVRLVVGPGDTLLLPSAWPHAVSTPEASLAVGEWDEVAQRWHARWHLGSFCMAACLPAARCRCW